ncbi:transketolase [Ignicoccus islandicus DSM 13165]|uniref:2-oxoacid oxidoreductase (ferredoxin) n=1 Tax=Ignicoccus islandicus DSM 13165 TaxID=940295 RepID=A0A0U3F332_9CREN|nr:transketolase family protein [Ignicoccus islandicus]ALU11941.1 transketolase [Ignicoccus islandicus DSM 13165]
MRSPRDAFGKSLVEEGEKRKDLVVLTADVADATRTKWFAEKFPDRFINVGISEQAMIGMSAGLSAVGFLPLASAFAMFLMRAWEQMRNMICRAHVNVKVVATHAGFSDAGDGSSHQCLEDVALMRTLPCMTVVVPADPLEVYKATKAILDYPTPVYMRIGRDYGPTIHKEDYEFEIGKAEWLRDGHDYVIVGNGPLLWDALKAADHLRENGISVAVINMHTVKPLDTQTLTKLFNFNGIVTIEEHSVRGGLGSAVAEFLLQHSTSTSPPPPMEIMGARGYGRSARDVRQLIIAQGLDSTSIINAVKRLERRTKL